MDPFLMDTIFLTYGKETHLWQPTPVFLLGNLMDRGAWWATINGVTKSRTRLSNNRALPPSMGR